VALCQSDNCFLFSESGVTFTSPRDVDINNKVGKFGKKIWCLMDAADYPDRADYYYVEMFSLIYVSSPKISRWNKIDQIGFHSAVFYMNPWSLNELKEAQEYAYPKLELEGVQKRFEDLGPTAWVSALGRSSGYITRRSIMLTIPNK